MQQYLDRHRVLKGIYLMVRRYFDHHVGRDSAALTYYLLFALFPLLIFLSNLVGIMSVDISGFLYEIRAFIPQEALEIIEQYGADALRFNLITGNSPGNDTRFYTEKCEAMRNFANKIWNASRFVMMNLTIDKSELPAADALAPEDK